MKLSPKLVVILGSILLFGLAALFTTPHLAPYSQGPIFGELASNPFIVHDGNGLHYRIFFPLLSWFLGFMHDNIIWTSLIALATLIALMLYSSWRRGATPTQAFLIGLFICVTIPAQFTLTYGGFPDALIYCLMLLMLVSVRKPTLFWVIFGVSLFTHESVVLQLPFLLLYRYEAIQGRLSIKQWVLREVLPALLIAFVPYFGYRTWVNSQMMSAVLDQGAAGSQMYCVFKALESPLTCMREANLLGWFFPLSIFGSYYYWLLVPFIQAIQFFRKQQWLKLLQYVAVFAAFAGSFPINLDTTRAIGFMLFPMIVLSLWYYTAHPARWKWLAVCIGAIFLTPHLYMINGTLRYFLGWPNWWQQTILSVYPQIDIISPDLILTTKLTLVHIGLATVATILLSLHLIDASESDNTSLPKTSFDGRKK